MLTHSAAYVLRDSNTHASALSSAYEKITTQNEDNDLRGLSDTRVGIPETSDYIGNTTSGVFENKVSVTKMTYFTGSNFQLAKEGVIQRPTAFNSMPKSCCFTHEMFLSAANRWPEY